MDILNFFSRSREARDKLQEYRSRLYRVAYSWTHNPALSDDLVQETLAKALQKSAQLRDPNAGAAWLFTIMANCFNDHFRRRRETEPVDELHLIEENTPESENYQYEIVGKVRAGVARLSDGQRQVLTLVDLEGFSYDEVANILGVPIGTVMSRLCRARNALKDILSREFGQQAGSQETKIRRVK